MARCGRTSRGLLLLSNYMLTHAVRIVRYVIQPSEDPTDDTYPLIYDQALDRFACALGGKEVLPPAFQYIPSMLASYDWRQRHAGLMAIAAIAEGTSKIMQIELGKVVA